MRENATTSFEVTAQMVSTRFEVQLELIEIVYQSSRRKQFSHAKSSHLSILVFTYLKYLNKFAKTIFYKRARIITSSCLEYSGTRTRIFWRMRSTKFARFRARLFQHSLSIVRGLVLFAIRDSRIFSRNFKTKICETFYQNWIFTACLIFVVRCDEFLAIFSTLFKGICMKHSFPLHLNHTHKYRIFQSVSHFIGRKSID